MFENLYSDFLTNSSSSLTVNNLDKEEEYISLPSLGYFHSGKYKNIDKIKLSKISYKEEMIIVTESYHQTNTLVEEILKSVIVDKNFPIHEITSVDKDTIFLWLKVGFLGKDHTLRYKCDKCDKIVTTTWDVGTLKLPLYSPEVNKELKEKGFLTVALGNIEYRLVSPSLQKIGQVNEFVKGEKEKIATSKLLSIIKEIKTEIKINNNDISF